MTNTLLSSILHFPFLSSAPQRQRKEGPCFILRWAILHLALCGNTQERRSQWTNAFHLAQSAFAGAGQQWPREYSGGSRRRPENGFRGACGSEAFCCHTFLQCCAFPPHALSLPLSLSRRAKQAAGAITWHISIQFPLPNVFIFGPNGMSFQRSLWSRINPGIKTDFPGSNLPSSIDFFTLTEPVLPNLTWQHTAQWTREHLGDSQRELSCVFSFSLAPTFHPLTPPPPHTHTHTPPLEQLKKSGRKGDFWGERF